jgi:DNA-binding response OmpR family regulator
MASQSRMRREPGVLVAAEERAIRRLLPHASDLSLAIVKPEEAAERALEQRPAVFAWLARDAAQGLATLHRLRDARSASRTLYLTPRANEAERLAALEAGVDEVLTEPITPSELAARLRLLLQRAPRRSRSRLPLGGDLELDLVRQALWRDGALVHLRPKEARLLELFARSPGQVHSRAQILERVWGPGHAGDPRTVDVHVRWLRTKIERDPHVPSRILTVRGVGYRLEPAVPLTER